MLRRHGRYDYSPINERPTYAWPNGKRLAVYVALNVEVFPFGEGMGPDLNMRQPEPDIPNFTWRDWGNRVGIWRLLDLFDELGLAMGRERFAIEARQDSLGDCQILAACTAACEPHGRTVALEDTVGDQLL